MKNAETTLQPRPAAPTLTRKRLGNQTGQAAINHGKIASDPAGGPFVLVRIAFARLQLSEGAEDLAFENVGVLAVVVRHFHPLVVGEDPADAIVPELDTGSIRIFLGGIERKTLDEDISLTAIHGGNPTGVAI